MQDYELLGHFYLGKTIDPATLERNDENLLYDSKDLTTHAICVGMTGSGKTGLGIGLLEEAAMDNVPALIIDPKGDMTNLLLTFPNLEPRDFMPWLQASDAERQDQSLEEYAVAKATEWRNGLAEWNQDGSRIATLKTKADFSVFTPGSSFGKPLSIIRMLDCPNRLVLEDAETLQDYTSSTISALLSLLNINADPLQSKEHILLSNILLSYWQRRESLDLAELIQKIVRPGMEKVGVLPLESFYPENERMNLAMRFNNLLASPQFSSWLEGEPLNIQNLLYTAEGKPRISILSINHLDDQERMFFVSTFLNQLLAWIRTQAGTSSLRALLYMDEIFGYFPPVAEPPSKKPLLSLLKQARAFGLGIVLATQNPADLDYKGLSNIGTWFVGRLQTEQDKNRLLDGLQTASQSGGYSLLKDRAQLSELLSKLPKRAFLMNNVHDNGPTLFTTRWCMSYLAGPLTRSQIAALNQNPEVPNTTAKTPGPLLADQPFGPAEHSPELAATAENFANAPVEPTYSPAPERAAAGGNEVIIDNTEPGVLTSGTAINSKAVPSFAMQPQTPEGIHQYYLPANENVPSLIYLPSLYAYVETTFEDKTLNLFTSEQSIWQTYLENSVMPVNWENLLVLQTEPEALETQGFAQASYAPLPPNSDKKTTFNQWSKELVDYIYRKQTYTLYANQDKSLVSHKDESKADFVVRLRQENRELRDQAIEDLRAKYDKKIATLQERIRKAEQAVEREKDQAKSAKFSTIINVGNTLLDTLLGNKKGFKRSTIGKAASSARSVGRSRQQQGDVSRAEETVVAYQDELNELELALENEVQALTDKYTDNEDNYREIQVKPKKKDILVKVFALVWLPHEVNASGNHRPLFDLTEPEQ